MLHRTEVSLNACPTTNGRCPLTSREQQVLLLIADGYSTKEIAARLEISFKTASCHRSHILAKTGVPNSVTLVRYAIRQGIIEP
jgi:DNA-binding NarL/FixJ family response regulator